MFTGITHPGELERTKKMLDAIEQDKQRAEAERAEAARPVDWQEYKQAFDRNLFIDILRLKTETCPDELRGLYEEIQRSEKQRRRIV